MERGVILRPGNVDVPQPLTGEPKKLYFVSGLPCSDNDIRKYLLYWDYIDFPQVKTPFFWNFEDNVMGENYQFLDEVDFLRRTPIEIANPWQFLQDSRATFSNGDPLPPHWIESSLKTVNNLFEMSQAQAFKENNAKDDQSALIVQPLERFSYPASDSIEENGIELELYDAIPVPGPDTPFYDILEFRTKRNSELLCFRAAMDRLYEDIISARDVPRSKSAAIVELEQSLCAINQTMVESKFEVFQSGLKMNLNVAPIAAGLLAGLISGLQLNTAALVAGVSALGSQLNFKVNPFCRPASIPDKLKAYSYLGHMQNNFRNSGNS